MDEQKKQKILLAILAVAALGAGVVYFVTRDTGPVVTRGESSGRVDRKQREATATTRAGRKERTERRETTATAKSGRKAQADTGTKKSVRRGSRRRKGKKAKKETAAPMGWRIDLPSSPDVPERFIPEWLLLPEEQKPAIT